MPTLCLMLLSTYYAKNYASIIDSSLIAAVHANYARCDALWYSAWSSDYPAPTFQTLAPYIISPTIQRHLTIYDLI